MNWSDFRGSGASGAAAHALAPLECPDVLAEEVLAEEVLAALDA